MSCFSGKHLGSKSSLKTSWAWGIHCTPGYVITSNSTPYTHPQPHKPTNEKYSLGSLGGPSLLFEVYKRNIMYPWAGCAGDCWDFFLTKWRRLLRPTPPSVELEEIVGSFKEAQRRSREIVVTYLPRGDCWDLCLHLRRSRGDWWDLPPQRGDCWDLCLLWGPEEIGETYLPREEIVETFASFWGDPEELVEAYLPRGDCWDLCLLRGDPEEIVETYLIRGDCRDLWGDPEEIVETYPQRRLLRPLSPKRRPRGDCWGDPEQIVETYWEHRRDLH